MLVTACQRPPPPPPPEDISSRDSAPAEPAFANLVWKVASGAETGAFYVFLGDGTLLMASAHGTPALGRWSHAGSDSLTLVEEGIAHPAAILRLDERELALRIFSPGPPVELTLVRAAPAMTPSGGSGADTLWGSAWVLEDIAGAGIIDNARATLEFATAGKARFAR